MILRENKKQKLFTKNDYKIFYKLYDKFSWIIKISIDKLKKLNKHFG